MTRFQVSIRVRPFNKRELELYTKCAVNISGSQIILNKSYGSKKQNIFTFDSCFDSMDPRKEGYACQEIVFDSIGSKILENAFKGWLKCKIILNVKYAKKIFEVTTHAFLLTDRQALENHIR